MARKEQWSTKKKLFLCGLASLGIVGIAAGGLALRAYDEATRIDRRYPEVVVRQYVSAVFDNRDDIKAGLYSCDKPAVGEILNLRSSLIAQEGKLGISTHVTVGVRTVSGETVNTELLVVRRSTSSTTERQIWRFTMVEEDGWRVCGAERVPDPTPTPSATPPTTPSPQ